MTKLLTADDISGCSLKNNENKTNNHNCCTFMTARLTLFNYGCFIGRYHNTPHIQAPRLIPPRLAHGY